MTDTRSPTLTGGCQCGAIRYALYAAPERTGICHCRMCQKATGGPFLAWTMVRAADFAWTRGKPGVFRSSSAAERDFCTECGTPLGFRYLKRPEWVDVTIGSLDTPGAVTPIRVMGAENRLPWCATLLPDVEPLVTGSLTPPEDLSRIRNLQHPDHDTPPGWLPP
jgi:hypothetical protein